MPRSGCGKATFAAWTSTCRFPRTTERNSPMKKLFIATALVAAMLVPASQALASSHHPKGEYAQFAECPLSQPTLTFCLFSESNGGFFQIGKKTVPLKNPVILQGGLQS